MPPGSGGAMRRVMMLDLVLGAYARGLRGRALGLFVELVLEAYLETDG